MKRKALYADIRLILGIVSVGIGLFAANLALFHWVEETSIYYLLGDYARYVCAYGGFGAMIFGSMLVSDFLIHRKHATTEKDLSKFLVVSKAEKQKKEAKEKKAVVRKARK